MKGYTSLNSPKRFRILVAEDNPDDLHLLMLAAMKAELPDVFHHAFDGEEALEYLRGEGKFADRAVHPFPDFVLLDIKMPRMSGFDALTAIRRDKQLRPLIVYMFSASGLEKDCDQAYRLGANGYFVKPSTQADLVRILQRMHAWQSELLLPRCGAPALTDAPATSSALGNSPSTPAQIS